MSAPAPVLSPDSSPVKLPTHRLKIFYSRRGRYETLLHLQQSFVRRHHAHSSCLQTDDRGLWAGSLLERFQVVSGLAVLRVQRQRFLKLHAGFLDAIQLRQRNPEV